MPRPLVFGNGRLLVQLDSRSRIRDFFWPDVGIRNHVGGHFHHFGVWTDGRFSWTEWEEWEIAQTYIGDTNVGLTTFECAALGLALEARDQVLEDSFLRELTVSNLRNIPREIELFFSQDFRIAESEIGDTALYRADLDAMVHFKWSYYFVCSGRSEAGGIHQKTVGLRGINGLQGTWRDAEDGRLQEKPIEQGAVDSTFSVLVECPPLGTSSAEYRIECCSSMPEVRSVAAITNPRDERGMDAFVDLPGDLREVADRSISILLTQIAQNGAILAANDSDIMRSNRATYSYVWPRDGALVANVLDRIGRSDIARRYHNFTTPLISAKHPFFLQKYCADGTLGATWHPWVYDGSPEVPLQEDETALTLWSIAEHLRLRPDPEWLGENYEDFIQPMAAFLATFVDEATSLPEPSYDLWEERRGVHTFTTATVVAGLEGASKLSDMAGAPQGAGFADAAQSIRAAMLAHLVDLHTGALFRGLSSVSSTHLEQDYTSDSSLLLACRFAGLPAEHPVARATVEKIERELWVRSPVGGLARYTGDYYGRVSNAYPGSPWVITTMWLAQEKIRAAKTSSDLQDPLKLLRWAADRADATGVMGEQFHPDTGEVLTVSPLTWSHAEFIGTCLDWCARNRELAGAS